jgi:hypothetical protein
MDQSAGFSKTNQPLPKHESRLFTRLMTNRKTEKAATPPQSKSELLIADNKKDTALFDEMATAPPAGNAALNARTSRGMSETVEVSGDAATVVAVEPSTEARLMARKEMPVVAQTKPTLPGDAGNMQVNTESAAIPEPSTLQAGNITHTAKLTPPASNILTNPPARNVTWTIVAGVLQRSLDSGQSWQDALRADHALLCYASRDADVWAGGQAGALLHSTDGGVTWSPVQPSIQGKVLSSDITHIELVHSDARGLTEIVLSTRNNAIWSSADGGKTWEKK